MTMTEPRTRLDAYISELSGEGKKGGARGYAEMVLAMRRGERKSLQPPKGFDLDATAAKAIRERLDFELAREVEVELPQVIARRDRGKPERYSLTSVQWAENCLLGMRFAREYDSTGRPALVGHIAHDCIDALVMHAYAQGIERYAPEEARDLAEAMLETTMHANPAPLPWSAYQEVLDHVERWAGCDPFDIHADLLLTECDFRHELHGVIHSARVDRLEIQGDTLKIRDYKTGQKLVSQQEFEERVQTPVYAWHAIQDYPSIRWLDLGEVYTRWGVVRSVMVPVEDLKVENYLRLVANLIDAAYEQGDDPEDWNPTPGPHCVNCANSLGCPKKGLSDYVPMHDENGAINLLRWITVTDAQLATAKKMLQQEALRLGRPIVMNGARAGFKSVHSKAFDRVEAELFIAKHGGTIDDFIKEGDSTRFVIEKGDDEDEAELS